MSLKKMHKIAFVVTFDMVICFLTKLIFGVVGDNLAQVVFFFLFLGF
jgi:hypothetical protein